MISIHDFDAQIVAGLGRLAAISASAAGIAVLVLLVQTFLGNWLTPAWRYRLWGLVVVRLLLPILPASNFSLLNLHVMDAGRRLLSPVASIPPAPATVRIIPVAKAVEPAPADATSAQPGIIVRISRDAPPAVVDSLPREMPAAPKVIAPPQPVNWWPTIVGAGWIAGVAILLVRLFGANAALARKLAQATVVSDPAILKLLQQCCDAMRIARPPAILITDIVSAPAAAGIWRPCILLPAGLFDTLRQSDQRAILLHELAHLRCRDIAASWLMAVLQILHWFNPVLWLAFARMKADREGARDAMVLSLLPHADGHDAGGGYSRTLLKLIDGVRMRPRLFLPAAPLTGMIDGTNHNGLAGLFGNRRGLKRRLDMIARFSEGRHGFRLAGPVLFALLALCTLTGAQVASPPKSEVAPTTRPANSPATAIDTPDSERIAAIQASTRKLISTRKYGEALIQIDRILVLDPQDEWALGVRPVVEDRAHFLRQQSGLAEVSPALKSQMTRAVKELHFHDATWPEAFTRLSEASGASFFLDWKSLAAAGIRKATLVRLDTPNATFIRTLTTILEQMDGGTGHVGFSVQDGVITIEAGRDLTADTAAAGFRLKDLKAVANDRTERVISSREIRDAAAEKKAVEDQLARTISVVSFDGVALTDVIDFLRDTSGANIFVNWKALERAGIARNAPVSARLRNVKVSKALNIILEAASNKTRLGYAIDEGVVVISTEDELTRDTVTRIYDIRDLITNIPDFDPTADGPLLGLIEQPPATRPAGRPATTQPTRQEFVDQICKLIEDTVDSARWRDRGGSVGSLRELQGQLIVTQTPENQEAIQHLFEKLRENRGMQITVEARYLSCGEQSVKEMIAGWERDGPTSRPTFYKTGTTQPADSITGMYLDEKQVDQFLKLSEASKENVVLAAPRMTLFNGQRAYVLVATQTAYTRDISVVKTANGETRYDPVIATAEAGVLMDVTATVSADRTYVTMTLRPKISKLLELKTLPWRNRPVGSNLTIQEPHIKTSSLETTISARNNSTLLLGGMEDPGIDSAKSPATQPTGEHAKHLRALYLLVKPTIILGQPLAQERFPLLKSKLETQPAR